MNVELAITVMVTFWGLRGFIQLIAGALRIERKVDPNYSFGDVLAGLFYIILFIVVMFV